MESVAVSRENGESDSLSLCRELESVTILCQLESVMVSAGWDSMWFCCWTAVGLFYLYIRSLLTVWHIPQICCLTVDCSLRFRRSSDRPLPLSLLTFSLAHARSLSLARARALSLFLATLQVLQTHSGIHQGRAKQSEKDFLKQSETDF